MDKEGTLDNFSTVPKKKKEKQKTVATSKKVNLSKKVIYSFIYCIHQLFTAFMLHQ